MIFGNCARTFWTIFPDSPYTKDTETRIRPSSNSCRGLGWASGLSNELGLLVVSDTKFRGSISQQEARMYHSSKVYKSGRNDVWFWSKIFGNEACQTLLLGDALHGAKHREQQR